MKRETGNRKCVHLTKEQIEEIRHLYFDEKLSVYGIGKLTGRNNKTIWLHLKKFGNIRSRSDAQFLANERGRCPSKLGVLNPMWKGGKKIVDGYIRLLLPPNHPFINMTDHLGYILDHRLVMAKYLGRCLQRWEIVHHKNGIKTDNRISNLAIVSRNNHPMKTYMKILQSRIRDLEMQLAQQRLL